MQRPSEPGEEWRPVVGHEDAYEVSSLGRVWSIPRVVREGMQGQRTVGGILRVLVPDADGRLRVWLPGGKLRHVHRLVADAFLGPKPPHLETRHLDGDCLNNAATNLQYGTTGENKRDQVAHGTHLYASRTCCDKGHEYTEENTHVTKRGRVCRACSRADRRAYVERNREAVNARRRKGVAGRGSPGPQD